MNKITKGLGALVLAGAMGLPAMADDAKKADSKSVAPSVSAAQILFGKEKKTINQLCADETDAYSKKTVAYSFEGVNVGYCVGAPFNLLVLEKDGYSVKMRLYGSGSTYDKNTFFSMIFSEPNGSVYAIDSNDARGCRTCDFANLLDQGKKIYDKQLKLSWDRLDISKDGYNVTRLPDEDEASEVLDYVNPWSVGKNE